MLFLINPAKRRSTRTGTRKVKAKRGGDPIVRNVAIAGGRRRVTTKSGQTWTIGGRGGKAKSASHKGGTTMASRKKGKRRSASRKRRSVRRNPRRSRSASPKRSRARSRWSSRTARRVPATKRRYHFRKARGGRGKVFRSNPGRLSLKSMLDNTVEGAKGAVAVIAGQAATRFIRSKIPVGGGMMVQVGLGVVSALGAGYVAGMLVPKYSSLVIAGGLSDVIRPFLAQVPVIGDSLSGDGDALGIGADNFLGSYSDGTAPTMGAYPALSGDNFLGAYAD